jgi:hypothetical protein
MTDISLRTCIGREALPGMLRIPWNVNPTDHLGGKLIA